jgi:hypothetical protein
VVCVWWWFVCVCVCVCVYQFASVCMLLSHVQNMTQILVGWNVSDVTDVCTKSAVIWDQKKKELGCV